MYNVETVLIEGSRMDVLVFEPEGTGPFPGVVVAQHIPIAHTGLEKDPFTIDVGNRMADAGYAAVIPFLFHWWPSNLDLAQKREEYRDDRAVADMDAAYNILTGLKNVDADRIGVMGHCWGGRISWLHACHQPNYKALATLYGGRIKTGMGEGAPAAISLTGNMKCEVLGLFGNEDQNPSPADVADLDAALTQAGIPHELHQYDGAGHGFQDFENPDRYRKKQSDDAWVKIFSFFDRTLKA